MEANHLFPIIAQDQYHEPFWMLSCNSSLRLSSLSMIDIKYHFQYVYSLWIDGWSSMIIFCKLVLDDMFDGFWGRALFVYHLSGAMEMIGFSIKGLGMWAYLGQIVISSNECIDTFPWHLTVIHIMAPRVGHPSISGRQQRGGDGWWGLGGRSGSWEWFRCPMLVKIHSPDLNL